MKLNIFFVCSLAICFSSMNLLLLTAEAAELCYPDRPSRKKPSFPPLLHGLQWKEFRGQPCFGDLELKTACWPQVLLLSQEYPCLRLGRMGV